MVAKSPKLKETIQETTKDGKIEGDTRLRTWYLGYESPWYYIPTEFLYYLSIEWL